MRRASVAAAGFALVEGHAADPDGIVFVAQQPDRAGRTFLACVEPSERSARGAELAAVALRTLRTSFANHPEHDTADALLSAFASANAAIIAENRPLTTGRWGRRICVGATAVVLDGREIFVAQAAPSQAILVQDGQVYAFPDIASWRGDYSPDAIVPVSLPLGMADDEAPQVFQSEAAPGDLILLCATNAGRALSRDEASVLELYGGALLTSDLEGSVDRLERLLARDSVTDTFAVVAAVTHLTRRSSFRSVLPRVRRPERNRAQHRATESSATQDAVLPALVVMPDEPRDLELADERPPAWDGLRDLAIEASERLAKRRARKEVKFDNRRIALAAPGAGSVKRYRDASGLPAEWRANLPRGPGVHVPARLLAVSLAIFLAVGGTGAAVGFQRDREAKVQAALASVDAALLSAQESPLEATTMVTQAEASLEVARSAGAGVEALEQREAQLGHVRDAAWNVQRLSNVRRHGALPHEIGDAPVHLALSGTTLYIAGTNLYELEVAGERLVTLLSKGDAVAGGASVGAVHDLSIDNGEVIAFDNSARYVRDRAGVWQRRPLAIEEIGGVRKGLPLLAWGEAAYGMSWNGNIIRFDETSAGPTADVWTPVEETPDLALARDMLIDGEIHVLLQDGRTLSFSRGALANTISPFVTPRLTSLSFYAQAPFAREFFAVDPTGVIGGNTGRIVRIDSAGNAVQYLTPAPGDDVFSQAVATSLAGAQDMAVDVLSGTVYWVSSGEIWSAQLPSA